MLQIAPVAGAEPISQLYFVPMCEGEFAFDAMSFWQISRGLLLPDNTPVIAEEGKSLFCRVGVYRRIAYDCARVSVREAEFLVDGFGIALCVFLRDDRGLSENAVCACVAAFLSHALPQSAFVVSSILRLDVLNRVHQCFSGADFLDYPAYLSRLSEHLQLFVGDLLILVPPLSAVDLTAGDLLLLQLEKLCVRSAVVVKA